MEEVAISGVLSMAEGPGAVPDPVAFEVHESDLDAMRADYLWHCHGIPRPWILGVGIAYLLLAAANLARHDGGWWFWVLLGALSLITSTQAGPGFPAAERATQVRFSTRGLDVAIAFGGEELRHYSWRRIRAIHDIGEAFVLVPAFGKRLVFPKRAFPDGGREAAAFFAAHGIAGRRPAVRVAAAS